MWKQQESTIDPALRTVKAPIEESGIYEVRHSKGIDSAREKVCQ